MKRIIFLILSLLSLTAFSVWADDELEHFDYTNMVLSIQKAGEPRIQGDYAIFTSEHKYRFVGIAFDFEEYKTIHPFEIKHSEDVDGNITHSVMFYALKIPENLNRLCYRVIIDGLWTTDPENPCTIYDSVNGLSLSVLDLPVNEKNYTKHREDDSVRFVYSGKPGQKVRLSGSFTNWDPWIYELEETSPGFYELALHLPEGTYYYNYYLGLNSIQDVTNPEKVYTEDGRVISVITIN